LRRGFHSEALAAFTMKIACSGNKVVASSLRLFWLGNNTFMGVRQEFHQKDVKKYTNEATMCMKTKGNKTQCPRTIRTFTSK